MRKIQMDCLPGLSGRLAHLQSSNILTTKMEGLLAELNMRYFNSANRLSIKLSTESAKENFYLIIDSECIYADALIDKTIT